MENQNKLAKDWFQVSYNELRDLMNQHYQISQANPLHESLPKLAAHIRRVAACVETWRSVAKYNATKKLFGGYQ